jgi:hypothetical protein
MHCPTLFVLTVHIALVFTLSIHCQSDPSPAALVDEIELVKEALTHAGFSARIYKYPETICFQKVKIHSISFISIHPKLHP